MGLKLPDDPRLRQWLTRKMLTHLRWKGADVRDLLPDTPAPEAAVGEENRPGRRPDRGTPLPTDEVFALADRVIDPAEVRDLVRQWINQDRISFLTSALEDQGSSLRDIVEALDRFVATGVPEADLPRSVLTALHVSLLRRFFTDDIGFINAARGLVEVSDFHALGRTLIYPPASHGKLGGKSAGLFLGARIAEEAAAREPLLRQLRVPRTWYIASDATLAFVRYNGLDEVYDRKYLGLDEIRAQYPHVVRAFKAGSFPPELVEGLQRALDDLGDRPLIVRSSSLLEDRTGASFSGKYRSLFLANRGTPDERLQELQDAIAEVYASIFGPDPIEYRAERGLLDVHEEMGIMIQEVVGRRVGRYFLPSFAGVAVSNNEFRWSPRIRREDGLIRLVPGLGTRAVDRLTDDYPVLLSPGQPGLRENTTPAEIIRYAPRMVDLIDLEGNGFESVPAERLLREVGDRLPMVRQMVSLIEHDRLRRPPRFGLDFERDDLVVTFDGLATDTPFLPRMAALLRVLRERFDGPVDLEFASDGEDLHILQCRPQSHGDRAFPPPRIPRNLDPAIVVFTAQRHVSTGEVPDLTHLVYVDPERYAALPDVEALREVGRVVGRLNKILPRRRFALIGPGRWGSRGDIRLGVSVTYSDIHNCALLVEVARARGSWIPDLSFGTHFFQDLVEAEIRYLPLYPDEPGNRFNERFLTGATNRLPDLLPDHAHLADTVHVIDVPAETGGKHVRVLMNGDVDEAIAFLA